MPIIRKHATIVRAINAIIIYSKNRTGRRCERANSLSKEIYTIGWKNIIKNIDTTTDTIARKNISAVVMVSMLPNRNADRSGVKPGARKLNIIPIAIPKVQNSAIAESSRTSFRLLNHSTPKAENIENIAAEIIGEKPKNSPIPIPPKEAWVMPPLMKTRRLVTMYVPTTPQAMLAKRLPSSALRKKA